MDLLNLPTRYLFFTGKGGVGKTALSCATALAVADLGRRVLLISTDPASNLEEMLSVRFGEGPIPVPGASNLWAMNVDPDAAAEAYRRRVIEPYIGRVSEAEIAKIREELSGACTVEIAAFDEFAGLLGGDEGAGSEFDHVIFDTAPTGHTLRLLSLPQAWSSFLEHNDRGAACLGPHSGLTMQQTRFEAARNSLADPVSTTVVLVARPDASALSEAARSSAELSDLGLGNQRLIVNGVFRATDREDSIALALEHRAEAALAAMPPALAGLPRDTVPLKPFNMVGLPALRALLAPNGAEKLSGGPAAPGTTLDLPPLAKLLAELEAPGHGLIMVMGKGGVGKTTIAAALAVALARRGHRVHLSTTDPAAHVAGTVAGEVPGLTVSHIDPVAETAAYTAKIMTARGKDLDAAGRALLEEDLKSPCTEEVAVFHAFSRIIGGARSSFVVLDTAPTGHSLLLMDATGAYHRQVLRDSSDGPGGRVVTPLMRLQNADYSRIILVTLAETTPVSEAAALQEDLRRARIEPFAWVINQSLAATGTRDPVLALRAAAEREQIERVRKDLAPRLAIVPWAPTEPVGPAALEALLAPSKSGDIAA
jgi:arsenite/tail-anchored protein-transporting ATPase